MAKKNITISLDEKSLKHLQQELAKYEAVMTEDIERFCEIVSRYGVKIAQNEIRSMGAFDTGELLASVNFKKGDLLVDGCTYYIYTDCEYAKFVEFGTGIVGQEYQHPNASEVNWVYDKHGHGENGWWYKGKDGQLHRTRGMPSRPFMHNTAVQLNSLLSGIAKEVFG